MNDVEQVLAVLRSTSFSWATEDDLQRGVHAALTERGMQPRREVRFGPQNRIDLVVDRVGIEIKVAGTIGNLTRQVIRYAGVDDLDAIVVVTSRAGFATGLPVSVAGKRIYAHLVGSTL